MVYITHTHSTCRTVGADSSACWTCDLGSRVWQSPSLTGGYVENAVSRRLFRLLCGGGPAPLELLTAKLFHIAWPDAKEIDSMRNVGVYFRVSEPERNRFRTWAETLDMSQSELFHALIQLDDEQADANPLRCVVLDSKTTRSLSREFIRWGYHFNQTNHALNSLLYYLSIEEAGIDDVSECLQDVKGRLDKLESGVGDIRYRLQEITGDTVLFC